MTIRNVTIGDKFRTGKHTVSEVVDFVEKKSLTTGQVVGHLCIVRGVDTFSTNTYEVPFTTVLRNRLDAMYLEKL